MYVRKFWLRETVGARPVYLEKSIYLLFLVIGLTDHFKGGFWEKRRFASIRRKNSHKMSNLKSPIHVRRYDA